MTLSASIIVCTYNPSEEIFSRTLCSIANLKMLDQANFECLIIDNNSISDLKGIPYIHEFLKKSPWARVIREERQGLTYARLAGIHQARYSVLIFVDDDNELYDNYLEEAWDHFNKYPFLGAWGPGNVYVEFETSTSKWFQDTFRDNFQERHNKYIEYGRVPGRWMDFYPLGTGLIIRREIAEKYCQEVESGSLSSSDRIGQKLISGGDIQLVWEAIKMGFSVGTFPELKINHLIDFRKSNLEYVKRLTYGTASSYFPALIQSFPLEEKMIIENRPSVKRIFLEMAKICVPLILKLKFKILFVRLAHYMGKLSGLYRVSGDNYLKWVDYYASLLGFI